MSKIVIALLTACMVSACNTMAGMGQDLRNGGQAVTDSARKVQDDMRHN